MSELDFICDFILKANDEDDFNFRFNHLINIVVILFESEIQSENHLPFNSHFFIEELNTKLNSIIEKINDSPCYFLGGYVVDDILLSILKEDFPEYYKNYVYQSQYRNN